MSSNTRFQHKVALVTGATSGIGKAVAFALAEAGASVVVAGRRVEEGRAVVEQITKAGGRAAYFKADTSKEEEVEKLVDFTVETFGRLDLAFNNAGVESGGVTTEVTEAEFDRVFGVNVWGVLASMKHEIRAMLKSGGGSIVNNSSVLGLKGLPNVAIYSASKHAVQGLTKSVALEYAKQGIRVNAVAPGPVQTEMLDRLLPTEQHKAGWASNIPLGRLGLEHELVAPVLILLDPANSFVTGTTLSVDGGISA